MTPRWISALVAALLLVTACGGEDVTNDAAAASEDTVARSTTTTEATQPDETTTSSTAAPSTTEVPETESEPACADQCLSDPDLAAIERVIDTYNTYDWEAFTDVLGTTEPAWDVVVGPQETRHIRADMIWADALDQTWTLGECRDIDGLASCELFVEDAFHRALDIAPGMCRLHAMVTEGQVEILRYDVSSCFLGYDAAFHAYGRWFEHTYPDQPTIQGFHYRAWNQFDETAGERARQHLDEYLETGAVEAGDDHHDH